MPILTYFVDLPSGELFHSSEEQRRGYVLAAKGVRHDGREGRTEKFSLYVEGRGWLPVTRVVQMKSNPSRHDCDARCLMATGRTMKCECSCGGKNHGRGYFVCE